MNTTFDVKTIKPNTLSVCMIVKNEADYLARCLQSVGSVADEIIVVDTGSTDSTPQIASSNGAKVILEQWRNDFAWARNISIRDATGAWILWLDADDIVPESALPLLDKLKRTAPDRVWGMIVRNERPNGTGSEFLQARMFPNRPDIYFERKIHEQMMPSALRIGLKMEHCDAVIEHHGYADPQVLKKKASRNVKMLLDEYDEKSPDAVMGMEIGDSYQLIEEFDNAEMWYRRVLDLPNCERITPAIAGQAHLGLGNILNKREKCNKALAEFRKAREIAPWRPDVLYSMAVSFENLGEIDNAIGSLQKILAMQSQPGQVSVDFRLARFKAYLRLIRLLSDSRKFAEAQTTLSAALENYPDRPEFLNAAARLAMKTGKLMDALHLFERSLNVARTNIDTYIGLCLIFKTANKIQKVFDTIYSIEPLFGDTPRYKAFRRYCIGTDEDCRGCPDKIYEEEMAALRLDYGSVLA